MKRKIVDPISILISSLILIGVGFFLVFNSYLGIEIILLAIRVILIILGALMLLSFMFKSEGTLLSSLFGSALYFLLASAMCIWPGFFQGSLSVIVGIWILINFLWRMISAVQLYINKDNAFIRTGIESLISLVFALVFLFFKPAEVDLVCIFLGIYMIIYGINMFIDFIREILYWDSDGKYIKRYIKWAPPVLLTAFIPKRLIEDINKRFSVTEKGTEVIEVSKKEIDERDIKLEVFIHMAPQIAMGFGHIDICFKDTVYSYGTYDSESNRLLGLVSDGVLARMEKEKYINHCLKIDNENIISFSVNISKDQEIKMQESINKIIKNCIDWECKAELDPQNEYDDPASVFYKTANAKFSKFKKGRYKTYFALSTNCVMMADRLLGSTGIDGIKMNGIITPGTYLSFLDDQFNRENTLIVKKRILV